MLSVVLWAVIFAGVLILVNLGFWTFSYARDDRMVRIRSLRRRVRHLEHDIHQSEETVAEAERSLTAELERWAKIERQTRTQLNGLPAEELRLLSEAEQRTSSRLNEITRLRSASRDNEDQALRQLQENVDQAIADLDRRIAGLHQAELGERDRALKRRQDEYLQQRLQLASLSESTRMASKRW
jgi:hypothetical protein